jgi:hypothetical protein
VTQDKRSRCQANGRTGQGRGERPKLARLGERGFVFAKCASSKEWCKCRCRGEKGGRRRGGRRAGGQRWGRREGGRKREDMPGMTSVLPLSDSETEKPMAEIQPLHDSSWEYGLVSNICLAQGEDEEEEED